MNIYKKTIVSLVGVSIAVICISDFTSNAHSNGFGAPAARTGSPGDGSNCTGCHSGTATTTAGLITSDVPLTGYIPGDTYTITATISVGGINKYGFEVSPQSTTGVKKGTLVVTDGVQTKLVGTAGKYITHNAGGTSGTGTKTWTFDWVAPATGSGDAIFYGAFLAANGNGTNSGDQVFLSSLLVQENLSAGIFDITTKADVWSIYPNPATEKLTIETLDATAKLESIRIYDITGKRIKTISYETFSQTQFLDIADLSSGMYVLEITSDKNTVTKKFVKE